MEENNEEVVEKTTYTPEEVEEIKAQVKKEFEEGYDKRFNTQWGKKMAKFEKENAKTNELLSLLKEQTGRDTIDELLDLSYEQYGVDRPTSDKDEEILGLHDAQELINLDDLDEIESEVDRLASTKRTAREQASFDELSGYLNTKKLEQKRIQEFKQAGIDEELLDDKDFNHFLGKFNQDTPVSDIYNIYKTMNQKGKPFSTGSLKDTKSSGSELFTLEEFLALTEEDLNNPAILEKALKSKKYFK